MNFRTVSYLRGSRLALIRLTISSALCAAIAGFAPAHSAVTVLYNFKGGSDGNTPRAGLIFDSKGALYGTTNGGGFNLGTVFKLTPPAAGHTQWTETVLHRFTGGSDSGAPAACLILDSSGALYGTTTGGGSGGGTVFKLTPPSARLPFWSKTVLHSFTGGSDGLYPAGGLVFGSDGALYGTTKNGGGIPNAGTVFKLEPPAAGHTQWTKTVLYNFKGAPDGNQPAAGLVFDSNGSLYGTTQYGGTYGNVNGGTVFKLTPPAAGHTQWTETVLHSFTSNPDGALPFAGLILDSKGALYGTTESGGGGRGTVFRLTPPATKTAPWTETVLYSFLAIPYSSDGSLPVAGLLFGKNGVLYGTTQYGGALGNVNGGTVFRLTPPAAGHTQWTETVLHSLVNTDGYQPVAGLVSDSKGALYGTATVGGLGGGTVFKLP